MYVYSGYYIIVLKDPEVQIIQKRLTNYATANQNDIPYYITGMLTQDEVQESMNFIVGDRKIYGGYFNAPLEPGEKCKIYLAAFSNWEGV